MQRVVKNTYETILANIQRDLNKWSTLPASLRSRIAVVKMNILPRVNFLSAMIPLPPPIKYWKRLESSVRQYNWNNKQPRLKFPTLQRTTNNGGLALPNFKMYHLAFQLRALRVSMDPSSMISWSEIEQQLIGPMRLQDFTFAGVCLRKSLLTYVPVITNTITNVRQVEGHLGYTNKWHRHTPLWHNTHFFSGNKPLVCRQWSEKGFYTLEQLFNVVQMS